MTVDVATLRARYEAAGQAHVFTFWDSLSAVEQGALAAQLESIDPARVNAVYRTAVAADAAAGGVAELAPPPSESFGSVLSSPESADAWNAVGLAAIAAGQVGVLLMAGGQGTRLGSSAPKGCYDIKLPSHKSFFEIQAQRIRKLELLGGGAVVPWYIMTSGPTRAPTESFFEEHSFFGLDKANVIFFEQGVLPCLTDDGKIFLESPSRVAVAPDGNGGIYAGLRAPLAPDSPRSVLTDLAARGIKHLHAYGVDNCLVRVADPTFLGYCISRQADCGAKVVKKVDPAEAVGVVALKGGKWSVVEYSEIPLALSEAREATRGDLRFRAANIANHYYSIEFLTSVASFEEEMAFHIARKKIPHTDLASGEYTKPVKPNGMKLELFIFDVFPFTKKMAVLEVARSTEFSPLKNAPGTGTDDPETSRRDILAEHTRWLVAAGAVVRAGVEIELSPLVSYAGEGLESVKGRTFATSAVIESVEQLERL